MRRDANERPRAAAPRLFAVEALAAVPLIAIIGATSLMAVIGTTSLAAAQEPAPASLGELAQSSRGFKFDPIALAIVDDGQPLGPATGGGGDRGSGGASGASADSAQSNNEMLNEANNPLTPKLTFNFHNYFLPSYYGFPRQHGDQLLLRAVVPHEILGLPQLLRITFPIEKSPAPGGGYDSGAGDLSVIDLFMFNSSGVEFGVGPMVVAPTASTPLLGSDAWQAGAAAIVVAPQEWGMLAGLLTFQQSIGRSSPANDVSLLTFQPLVIFNIPEGFYLRSTAIWNFNFDSGDWYIPAGFGVGHVWTIDRLSVNLFVEPQYTLFHDGPCPQWQIFAGVNVQIAF